MDAFTQLATFLHTFWLYVMAIGTTLFFISIAFAGIIRLPIFGISERRTALSNLALASAVIALIIMFSAIPLHAAIETFFPPPPGIPTPIGIPLPHATPPGGHP